MRLLLDTNAYTAFMRGDAEAVEEIRRAEKIYLSSIVVGELLYGFRSGMRYRKNRSQLDEFLASRFVGFLPVTLTTADRYGLVFSALKRKGTPIPSNDIWIAAHALETGTDLLSYDNHFAYVDGLAFLHLVTPSVS
jgi:tRNA(fMet)-specific endonuclease VapC